jgi:hypothetical protein
MRQAKRFWMRVMHHYLTGTFRELLRTFAEPFDHYRPELHYMRGPGPKCLAKKRLAKRTVLAAAPETEGLAAEAAA